MRWPYFLRIFLRIFRHPFRHLELFVGTGHRMRWPYIRMNYQSLPAKPYPNSMNPWRWVGVRYIG